MAVSPSAQTFVLGIVLVHTGFQSANTLILNNILTYDIIVLYVIVYYCIEHMILYNILISPLGDAWRPCDFPQLFPTIGPS